MLRDISLENMGLGQNLSTTSQGQHFQYMPTATPRQTNRPRPSSARDTVYADLIESGYYNQGPITRPRAPHNMNSPYDGRAASLEREQHYPGAPRGYYHGQNQRVNRFNYPAGGQGAPNISHQPQASLYSSATGGASQRRAQSYEMNLEKQGLYEYNSALASSGVGTNPGTFSMYGNLGGGRIDSLGAALAPMTPVVGYSNPVVGVPNYGNYGISNSSGVMTLSSSADLVNIQRECVRLHQELDMTKEKLNACMTSIRTFWSPELKRERAMRKEENAKYAILADHLHQLQLEKQVGFALICKISKYITTTVSASVDDAPSSAQL